MWQGSPTNSVVITASPCLPPLRAVAHSVPRCSSTPRCRLTHPQVAVVQMLFYLKAYPTLRQLRVYFGSEATIGNLQRSIHRRIALLRVRMAPLLTEAWARRHVVGNPAAPYFDGTLIGSVDSFPIFINRPKDPEFQAATYQGKYKVSILTTSLSTCFVVAAPPVSCDCYWLIALVMVMAMTVRRTS